MMREIIGSTTAVNQDKARDDKHLNRLFDFPMTAGGTGGAVTAVVVRSEYPWYVLGLVNTPTTFRSRFHLVHARKCLQVSSVDLH